MGTPLTDLGPLIADALAEQSEAVAYGRLNATVSQAIGNAILHCLIDAAPAMYENAAKAFDQAVAEAIDAWTVVSPLTDVRQLIGPNISDKERDAYQRGQTVALAIESTLTPLVAAARLCDGASELTAPYKGKSGGIISRAPNQLTVLDLIIERPAEVSTQQAALDAWNGSVGHEGGGRFWRLFDAGLTIRAGVPAEARPFEVASMPKPPPPVTGSQPARTGATGRTDGPKGKDLLGTAPDGTAVAWPYIGRRSQ